VHAIKIVSVLQDSSNVFEQLANKMGINVYKIISLNIFMKVKKIIIDKYKIFSVVIHNEDLDG